MNKLFVMLLALGLIAGVQTITIAEETAPAAADAMAAEEGAVAEEVGGDMMAAAEEAMDMSEGTVVSTEAESGKVVINYVADPETGAASDADFWVKEGSMVMKNDAAATIADVAAGDKVAFAYAENEEGGKVLSHLHVIAQ